MRFGVGRDQPGVVIFLTLGTGVGSGVFVDGILVPNTEFGQMEIRGRPAERRSAAAARIKRGLSWKAWAADLDEHLDRIQQLMWPNLMIVGGGVSKSADKFIPRLTVRCPGRSRPAAQRCRDHRRGDRRGRVVARGPGRLVRHRAGLHRRRPGDTGRGAGPPTRRLTARPLVACRPCARRAARVTGVSSRAQTCRRRAPFVRTRRPTMTTPTAASADPTTARMFIGGEPVDALDGQTFEVVNPATGEVIATVPLGGKADVDRAVEAAQKAFDGAAGRSGRPPSAAGRSEVRRPGQEEHRGARPDRPRERRQADHRRRAASRSRSASCSSTTPAPRTSTSARRSRRRCPGSTSRCASRSAWSG